MEPVHMIRSVMKMLGRPLPGNISGRYLVCITLSLLMLAGSVSSMVTKWPDIKSRFLAFEDIIIVFDLSAIFIEFALFPSKAMKILRILERKPFTCRYPLSRAHAGVVESTRIAVRKTVRYLTATVFVYSSCNCLVPVVNGVLAITDENFNRETIDHLPLAFESWLPFKIESLYFYYAIVVVQSSFIVIEGLIFLAWNALIIVAYVMVEKELQLLSVSVSEIDVFASDESKGDLHDYLRDLVVHHQSIIKVVEELNEASSFLVFMLNQIICCQICVGLYASFEVDETAIKLKYRFVVVPVLFCFGMFCYYGQCLVTADENFRMALTSSSWTDKPVRFKKALLMMITRSNKPLQIKPLSLYVLDLQNFSMVLRAAYSYYNLLRTLQKQIKQ